MKTLLAVLSVPLLLSVPSPASQQSGRATALDDIQFGDETYHLSSATTPLQLDTTGENALLILNRTDGAQGVVAASANFFTFGAVSADTLQLNSDGQWRVKINPNNSIRFRNGAIVTQAGTFVNASSRALKENIHALSAEDARATLAELEPVRFNYKVTADDEQVGFIAEDVPELVATEERTGVASMDITAVLTRVVQDQQRVMDEQEQRIADLTARLEALEASVAGH